MICKWWARGAARVQALHGALARSHLVALGRAIVTTMLKRIYYRLYQNFLMRSRIWDYRRLLLDIKQRGYEFITVRQLAASASGKRPLPERACIIRVDVDSDVSTARVMFETEKDLGVKATYYFRLD